MTSLHLRPLKGQRVLKPGTKTPLSKDGEIVDDSSYWRRRLLSGEVEHVKEEVKEIKSKNQGSEK